MKLMKKLKILIAVSCIAFSLIGCSYKTYFDSNSYEEVWDYSGFHPVLYNLYEESLLFPKSIKELNVEKYFARYDEQIPLGEGFQILLSVVYEDEAEFAKEIERIASIAEDCTQYYGASDDDSKAYATIIGWESSAEYAIIDYVEQKVDYIYLQSTEVKDIEIDHDMLLFDTLDIEDIYINVYEE